MEVIPFKTFVAGSTFPHYTTLLDGGLTFFCGLGAAVLVIHLLEKKGVQINESKLRWLFWGSILALLGLFALKNPLWLWI
ncbi:MAG: hypothetical protein ACO1OT_05605 [Heyndrickxia sp.]